MFHPKTIVAFVTSHGAAAAEHLGGHYELLDQLKLDYERTEISDKLKALLAIAGKVQKGGKHVTLRGWARHMATN